MKSFRHTTGSALSAIWPAHAGGLSRRSQILMYHSIGGVAVGDRTGLYSISEEQFTRQIELLYQLQLDGLLKIVPFGQEQDGSLSITFDDGYRDNLTIATPILERFNFPFHIFLNPSLIESHEKGFLSEDDLRILKNHPLISLGLHGYSHRPMTSLSTDEVRSELKDAQSWFADQTSTQATSLSYPHGSVDDRVISLVKESQFSLAACSKFGPLSSNSDRFRLPRIDLWSSDSDRSFRAKIMGNWDWMRWRT